MKPRYSPLIGTWSAFAAASALLLASAGPALRAEVETNADVQVLTRGPVHEAFAESVSSRPEPGLIVTTAPPAPIEELPPEHQLDGENVTWISGYWAWDDDQDDFLWISGVWRNLPPGRQWVPGYWSAIDDGRHQWTSGYWADSETRVVAYLSSAPPRSVDVGPNIAAPSDDCTWIPGNWIWGDTRYVWRPGYWTPFRENWTWVPSRYCWSPRGYIYVDGYWDYAVASRGVLFAPVHFRRHLYAEPSYCYTPSVVVSLNVFTDHLFVRPSWGHYYFGDYYAPGYVALGFFPSHRWHARRGCFDPVYAHQRWQHRHEQNWERGRQDHYNYYRDNEGARPAHNWAAMQRSRAARFGGDDRGRTSQFASPLADLARNPDGGQRFRSLETDRRSDFVAQRQEMRKFGQERRQIESRKFAPGEDSRKVALRETQPRSPVVGRQAERFATNEAPPKRPEASGTNLRVVPTDQGTQQPRITRADNPPPRIARQATPAQPNPGRDPDGRAPPGKVQRDREGAAAAPGTASRENTPNAQARQLPGRRADALPQPASQRQQARELPRRGMDLSPQRQLQPKPQLRQTPQRSPLATPHRQTQAKLHSRQTPERQPQAANARRQVQPKQEVRPAPQPRQQAAPQRQSQPRRDLRSPPQRMKQTATQRQSQPRRQVRPAPQPTQQATPHQQSQPRQQVRQAPHRQAHPAQRQTQPSPQVRQAQPRQDHREPQQPQKRRKKEHPTA